ncbi:MAG: hypothetical protein NXI22_10095, partial [bacterium]|nr:hypothetical protein [bacterium]
MSSELLAAAGNVEKDRFMLVGNGELDRIGSYEVEGNKGFSAAILVKGMTIKVTLTEEQCKAYEHLQGKQVNYAGIPKGGEKGMIRISTLIDLVSA